jgi:uncharacterized integral membrane protein
MDSLILQESIGINGRRENNKSTLLRHFFLTALIFVFPLLAEAQTDIAPNIVPKRLLSCFPLDLRILLAALLGGLLGVILAFANLSGK